MWRSHLRLALRSLRRDRGYALLNGVGLAVAIGACVLIALFVRDELSSDRHVPHADRVVVMGMQNAAFEEDAPTLSTPYGLALALADGVPGVERAVAVTYGGGGEPNGLVLGASPDDRHEVRGFFADADFFDVFRARVVAGDPGAAMRDVGGAVITAPAAERAFGSAEAALGQARRFVLMGDTLTATVRSVVEEAPATASFPYEVVLPMQAFHTASPNVSRDWGGAMYRTAALLRPGTDAATVAETADRLAQLDADGQAEGEPQDDGRTFAAVPLADFHLSELSFKDGFSGSPVYLRLFGAVATLILLLSAINYVNLATARGAQRAQEVGVRKALGAGRSGLVAQFLAESVVLAALAGLVGVALAALALPLFNETFGKALSLGALDGPFWAALAVGVLAVGLAAGLYPALRLSRFSPSRALGGGRMAGTAAGGTWLRRTLVGVQFASAVGLLAMTAVVGRQLHHVQASPLGFAPGGLIAVEVRDPALGPRTDALVDAFEASPAVVAAAGVGAVPPGFSYTYHMPPDPRQPDRDVAIHPVDLAPEAFDVLGLEVVHGRPLDADLARDATGSVLVNQAFAAELGYSPAEVVGRTMDVADWEGAEIVGVVRDFHFEGFKEPVGAVALAPNRPGPWDEADAPVQYQEIAVRAAPGREAEAMTHLEAAWAQFSVDTPLAATFVADDVAALHADEANLARVFAFFALVAVVLAAFGLVGLASYAAARRTKEVGVRRVLGATVADVVALLSREYVALAAVGVAVATPVAAVAARRWLEGFAYQAPLSPWLFAAVAAVAVAVAVASVAGQAVRAATADPTALLRSE